MSLGLPLEQALGWTQRLLALGVIVQGIEGWVTRDAYGAAGVWGRRGSGAVGASGIGVSGIGAAAMGAVFAWRVALGFVLCWPGFRPVGPGATLVEGMLLATSGWLTVRTRGPLCGGSDSMGFQVQLGLFAASWGTVHAAWAGLGLGWIAAQSVLSYFLAGVGKLRHRGWWTGAALRNLLQSDEPYAIHPMLRAMGGNPGLCRWAGWAVTGFQLAFPLVLVGPSWMRLGLIAAAFCFHLGNAVGLGLNRFLWAWLATYPALLYFG